MLGYQTSPCQTFMNVSKDVVLRLNPLLDLVQELHTASAAAMLAEVSIAYRQGVGGGEAWTTGKAAGRKLTNWRTVC